MSKLFYNGNIYTMDDKMPRAEAFVVNEGKISFVGSSREAKAFAPNYDEINLEGQCVIPGFIDSHMHFIDMAQGMLTVDLSRCKSIEEIKEKFLENLDESSNQWLEGSGWNQDFFQQGEKRFPRREDLDQVSKRIPILADRACVHVGTLNSKGLEVLNLTEEFLKRYENLYERDEEGFLNGVVKEGLLDYVKGKISSLNKPLMKELIVEGQKRLFSLGITSIQTDDIGFMPRKDYSLWFNVLDELREESLLKVKIGEQCMVEDIEKFVQDGYDYGGDEQIRRTCIKIYNDGSLGARTAGLSKGYCDAPSNSGIITHTVEEMYEKIKKAHDMGYPVGVHAIGDKAISITLDAIEMDGKRGFRDGIIHAQITDEKILERFAKLDVMAYVQPIFIDYDMDIVKERVGPLAETSYAWKTLMDKGVHVSFGTDCPVEGCDPIPNIYCAVSRKNLEGEKIYRHEEKVSVTEAIKAYTVEGAYASGEEEIKGSISLRKAADFVFISKDIFNLASEEEILDTKVTATYINGVKV